MCTMCVPGAHVGQKKVSRPLTPNTKEAEAGLVYRGEGVRSLELDSDTSEIP